MKGLHILFAILFGAFHGNSQDIKYPEVEISNGIIKANLYLLDAENGYYKGTRFDWSGVISSLEFNEHTYFGQWFDADNPQHSPPLWGLSRLMRL